MLERLTQPSSVCCQVLNLQLVLADLEEEPHAALIHQNRQACGRCDSRAVGHRGETVLVAALRGLAGHENLRPVAGLTAMAAGSTAPRVGWGPEYVASQRLVPVAAP